MNYLDIINLGKVARLAPNNIVFAAEYNNEWLFTNGVNISVDPSTNIFETTTAHGLSVGAPLEFWANGGEVPGGLESYDAASDGVGLYYNVATVPDTTHFTVTATVGSTTPLDITSAGNGAWRVRNAGFNSFDITGLNLKADGAYDVDIILQGVLMNSTGTSICARLNNDSTALYNQSYTDAWTVNGLTMRTAQTKKYGLSATNIRLVRVSDTSAVGNITTSGRMSDDKSTAISLISRNSQTYPNFYVTGLSAEVTSIRVYVISGATGLIRNGVLAIVRRVN
jgi:hypothetical protein